MNSKFSIRTNDEFDCIVSITKVLHKARQKLLLNRSSITYKKREDDTLVSYNVSGYPEGLPLHNDSFAMAENEHFVSYWVDANTVTAFKAIKGSGMHNELFYKIGIRDNEYNDDGFPIFTYNLQTFWSRILIMYDTNGSSIILKP